jgi:protein-S-isoprenylcysteine O-methyltransferase Ste14
MNTCGPTSLASLPDVRGNEAIREVSRRGARVGGRPSHGQCQLRYTHRCQIATTEIPLDAGCTMTDENSSLPAARTIRVMPPVYLLLAIAAMIGLHCFLPGAILIESPWRWVGVAILIAGLVFGLSAVRLFRKYQTTIKPGQTSTHLMTGGPFRLTRNPIYVGMTVLLIGVATLLGSATPWLLLPLFVGVIAINVIPVEEAIMAETFGAEYASYRARVRRWL